MTRKKEMVSVKLYGRPSSLECLNNEIDQMYKAWRQITSGNYVLKKIFDSGIKKLCVKLDQVQGNVYVPYFFILAIKNPEFDFFDVELKLKIYWISVLSKLLKSIDDRIKTEAIMKENIVNELESFFSDKIPKECNIQNHRNIAFFGELKKIRNQMIDMDFDMK